MIEIIQYWCQKQRASFSENERYSSTDCLWTHLAPNESRCRRQIIPTQMRGETSERLQCWLICDLAEAGDYKMKAWVTKTWEADLQDVHQQCG